MDIEYLLVLQDFREGAGQFLRELFMKMTFLTDKETSIVILLVHQQGVRKPSVPAAGIVCLSSVFQAIGVAPEVVEIVLCITPILNMFNTAAGASTNVTSTTILASLENCIDRTVFNKAKE